MTGSKDFWLMIDWWIIRKTKFLQWLGCKLIQWIERHFSSIAFHSHGLQTRLAVTKKQDRSYFYPNPKVFPQSARRVFSN